MRLDDDLLLSIALDPGDDPLRHVYADRLLERGSGWGELIKLQLMAKKDAPQLKRERELLGLAEAYLPDVIRHAIVSGSSRWERGFMVGCAIKPDGVGPALFHPLWNLVRSLHGAPVELLSSCPNLVEWTGAVPGHKPPLVAGLEVLGVHAPRADATWLASLGIDELHLTESYGWYPCDCCEEDGWPPYRSWHGLGWLSDASIRMTTLRVHFGAVELEPWLDQLGRARLGFSRLALRSVGSEGWELELTQSAPGKFDRAALKTWSHGRPIAKVRAPKDLELMLKHVSPGRFSRLALHGEGWTSFRRLACFHGAEVVRVSGSLPGS